MRKILLLINVEEEGQEEKEEINFGYSRAVEVYFVTANRKQ